MDFRSWFVFPVKGKNNYTLHKEEPTMKKAAMMMTAALLACTVGATGVWAAGPGRNSLQQTAATAACRFVDEDGDGICDNHADGVCRYDADGDGLCDRAGQGSGWVDADGDGVCDNWTAGSCQGGGYGGHGCHGWAGACRQ